MARSTLRFVATIAGLALTATAGATVINGNSLQNGLNNLTYGDAAGTIDADFYDVNTSQVANDEVWNITAPSVSTHTLLFEFAGYRNSNVFGIYDVLNPANTLQVFSGGEGAGSIEVTMGLGSSFTTLVLNGGTDSATFSSRNFGYYLSGPGGTFYSQSALNVGGADQMVAFQGAGDIYIDPTGYGASNGAPGQFTAGHFILAWEDLPFGKTDGDYEDFVVMVSNVTPVPAPAALGLLGLALMGLGISRRRS